MEKIRKALLFNASCLALVVTALAFGTRGGFITPWMEEFSLTATQVGWIVGTAFGGFTIAMVIFGPLVDIIGFLGGAIAQPSLGKIYDINLAKFANDHLAAGAASLRTVIILTVFLTAAFLFLFLKYRNSKN